MHVSAHAALTFAWILPYLVIGTASAHPTFLFSFLTGSASSLPPRQNWFHLCYHSLSLLSGPFQRSAQAITAVRWVLLGLRRHAGVTLFRRSRIYSRMSFSVLQDPRSSVCSSWSKSMPEWLDRAAAPRYCPTLWSSVSAIFRWRPH